MPRLDGKAVFISRDNPEHLPDAVPRNQRWTIRHNPFSTKQCISFLRKSSLLVLITLTLLSPARAQVDAAGKPIDWRPWSDSVFAQAKREHKFVLLDLEAVWCHWCHVMDAVTYADPDVRRVMHARYLAVKVDQDSRPDIANRYQDYGWPATVVFGVDGKEIVKRQGFIPPKPMLSMLQAIIDDPSPGPSVEPEQSVTYSTASSLSPVLLERIRSLYQAQYDKQHGGWGFVHKYLDADSAEYALVLSRTGDAEATQRVRDTLRLEQKLLDPAWGGAYQYSAGGDWQEPHFEKLISIQAQVMRIYALAYAQYKDPDYLRAAESVHRYVKTFLTSPDGAFYVSQDADLVEGEHAGAYFKLDDSGRRKLGVPRVDKHLYARENGWMITALADFYAATGNQDALAEAKNSAEWVLARRALPGGGFRHSESILATPYLADTLAMGQAFLALSRVTSDPRWLQHAEQTLPFIASNFSSPNKAGFLTSKAPTDRFSHRFAERDENVALARFSNLLYQYTGESQAKSIAEQSMRYLATPAIAIRPLSGGELLAIHENTHAPLHITVVGQKQDPASTELFTAALRSIRPYERLEWIKQLEPIDAPNMPQPRALRTDVVYPSLAKPAAFICHDTACGDPIYAGDSLMHLIENASISTSTVPSK